MCLSETLLKIIEEEQDAEANMVHFMRLTSTAKCPTYATKGAAGLDMYADEYRVIFGGDLALIKCGFAMALPDGFEAQVRPRSGLALKHGITVFNSPGTIDSDYRGQVCAMLYNATKEPFSIQPGDRVAQMVIARCVRAKFREKLSLDDTVRGTGGFGSTGTR